MKAEFKRYNGAMGLFINFEPVIPVAYKPTEMKPESLFAETVARSLKDVAERGVHLHFVPVDFEWTADGIFDFSPVDDKLRQVFRADRDAYLVVRIQSDSMRPGWWLEANPDKVLRFSFNSDGPKATSIYSTNPSPSLASDFWERYGLNALERLVEYLKGQDYWQRIAGFLPTAYNSNEWFVRSYEDLCVNDLCTAMQQAFGRHLRDKFGIDGEITVPDRIARAEADKGYFFHPDPRVSKFPVVEFYSFLNGLCAEKILKITETIRKASLPDKIIVGNFYGYSQGLANFYWLSDSGHLCLSRLMEEDGPDFTCSPYEYFTRNMRDYPGGGFCWSQSCAPDSGMLHGKAYWGEDDFCPVDDTSPVGWSGAKDEDEDAEMLKRNFIFSICKGQFQWWYDLRGHWYEGGKRLETVEHCVKAAHKAMERDRTATAQIAVIVDERASWYMTLDKQFQRAICWENFYYSFGNIGAPVDLLLLSDLEQMDMERYKAVFMPNCFCIDDSQRKAVNRLKTSGRSVVFYGGAGFINPDAEKVMDVSNICRLTGINIVSTEALFQFRVTLDNSHELTAGCEDHCFGTHLEKSINFYVDDSEAQALGYYSGRGPVGLACRKMDGWKSFYCGVLAMPPRLVRNIAADAGVHIYSDNNDILYANRSYVGVYITDEYGPRKIRLPENKKVREYFSGSEISQSDTDSFVFNAEKYTSYLFELY